ncbi:hypothetical protein AURDEDRAFT_116723, partial [Auricularia subglabra TFB-10046 SS5]
LQELSLRDVPRFYERSRYPNPFAHLDHVYSPRILSCTETLSIFRTLHCCVALRHLELVVTEDDEELQLLAYVAASCPGLEFFELHCYRNVSEYSDLLNAPLAVSLDALGRALSAFRALRTARLNIDLPWSLFTISPHANRETRDGVTYSGTIAQIIAHAVPWLKYVCVLTCGRSGVHQWRIWAVYDREGTVELERLEASGLDKQRL